MNEPTYVIAHYNEDLTWADNLKKVVIHKDIDLPNIGRETSSYFYFIVTNYCNLEGDYIFTQGNPFDHQVNFAEGNYFGVWHECDESGMPEHLLPITECLEKLRLAPRISYHFKAGAIFKLSAEEIKRQPYEFYVRCFLVSLENYEYPFVFERIFPLIFPSLHGTQ